MITMDAVNPSATESIGHLFIPIERIDVSKTNPRTHFDQGKLDELAESIQRFGILQPIVVRPIGERYELVAGERRLRASRQLGNERIPATVRELDDKEVLEVQVIENLQRADLHPLEEAEGYQRLIEEHGYDADTLALKIGKSRRYVYARIQLVKLAEPVKKALWDDKIHPSIALHLARIPDAKLQVEALKEISRDGREMSVRDVAALLQRDYMLKLASAPFDVADGALLPTAGPCTTCPMRTGNQSELFDDIKNADVCTNPSCFSRKVQATLKAQAEERGWGTLSAEQTKKVFPYQNNGSMAYDAAYVDAEDRDGYSSSAKKYKELLGDESKIVLARDPAGKIRQLIARKDLPQKTSRGARAYDPTAMNRNYKRSQTLRTLTEKAITDAVFGALKKPPTLAQLLPLLAAAISIERPHERLKIAKQIGAKAPEGYAKPEKVVAFVEKLTPAKAVALIVASLALGNSGDQVAVSEEAMKLLGLDRKALITAATAKVKAKWAAEDGKKKPAAKKKSRGKK